MVQVSSQPSTEHGPGHADSLPRGIGDKQRRYFPLPRLKIPGSRPVAVPPLYAYVSQHVSVEERQVRHTSHSILCPPAFVLRVDLASYAT